MARFFGIAADDKFGVIIRAYDISNFIAVRVNNATAAPKLEIVDVVADVETVISSIDITQIITPALGTDHWWDVGDHVWVAAQIDGQNFITATVYTEHPDHEISTPLYHFGYRLPKTP